MSSSLTCSCGNSMEIAEASAGERVQCPACNEAIIVPGAEFATRAKSGHAAPSVPDDFLPVQDHHRDDDDMHASLASRIHQATGERSPPGTNDAFERVHILLGTLAVVAFVIVVFVGGWFFGFQMVRVTIVALLGLTAFVGWLAKVGLE